MLPRRQIVQGVRLDKRRKIRSKIHRLANEQEQAVEFVQLVAILRRSITQKAQEACKC